MYKVIGNAKCSLDMFSIRGQAPLMSSGVYYAECFQRNCYVKYKSNIVPQGIISEEYISQNHIGHILCNALRNVLFYMRWSFFLLFVTSSLYVTIFRAEEFPTLIFIQRIIIFNRSEASHCFGL
jgi:hypothetical protein